MQRTSFNITFSVGERQLSFSPNAHFWMLFGASTIALGWLATEEMQAYRQVRDALISGGGLQEQPNTLSPSAILPISVALSMLLRVLINYLIRLGQISLLPAGPMGQHVMLSMGRLQVPMRFGRRFWAVAAAALLLTGSSFYYLHASNEEISKELQEMRDAQAFGAMEAEAQAQRELEESEQYKQDVIGYFMDHLQEHQPSANPALQNYREAFLVQKQLIASRYLINAKASRIDQLPSAALLSMNREISGLFLELVIKRQEMPAHVYRFFTDTMELHKLETALMEQAKYHVPASIKLAQAALETAYGRRVVSNNYFGIKDKQAHAPTMETIEYYNEEEMRINAGKIIAKEVVTKGGKKLYKCRVSDSFMQYATPWESFRAHSLFLAQNQRYHMLFTGGKDYRAWADRIGSTKYGGVGYATSPVYGELLKKIIQRYSLDLLDH